MLAATAKILKRIAAAGLAAFGWFAYRLGGRRAARRAFEQVLRLGGDEFTAYVHLGRIALGEGDFAGYRREMNNARSLDPERFARLRPSVDGVESRWVGSPSEESGERATWRSVRPGNQGYARRTTVRSAEAPTEGETDPEFGPIYELPRLDFGQRRHDRRRTARDDFSSSAERARFRDLPPLRHDDVRTADVDELSRRLGS
jgi:hypothetical protein